MRNRGYTPVLRLLFTKCLLLILPLVMVTGCTDRTTGLEIATAGRDTANTLADLYESLIQDRFDTLEIQVFMNALDGGMIDETQRLQQLAWREVTALRHRAEMGRQMVSTYDALKSLTTYDASGEVKAGVDKLVGLLQTIPVLRGPIPRELITALAGEAAGFQQSRDIRRGVEFLLRNLETLAIVFEREKPAYKSIAQERGDEILRVYHRVLTLEGRLQLWPQVREMVESLRLPTSVDDPRTAEAYKQLAQVRARRIWVLSENAADSTGQALSHLVDAHRAFANRRGPNLSEIAAFLKRARSYLDEIAKLRAEKK